MLIPNRRYRRKWSREPIEARKAAWCRSTEPRRRRSWKMSNRVYKHVRRSQKHPQGGRLSKEMPIQLSNVMYVCESCNARTRLGARYTPEGAKERFCKKCGASAGEIAPAHKAYAQK